MADARERHLRVQVSDQTIEALWRLQVQHGLSRAELIEQLVDDAAEAAKRENAERPKATPLTKQVSADATEEDEPEGGSRPTLASDCAGPHSRR